MSDFSSFSTLSFDCYGTLIDWETGILEALEPMLRDVRLTSGESEILGLFGKYERQVQAGNPSLGYPEILELVYRELCVELGLENDEKKAIQFGESIGHWPAFPDSRDALQALSSQFRLYILSNIDRRSFALSKEKLGVSFDGIVTAQDVGSYKPDPRNFEALLEASGTSENPASLLHVGESIYHDVAPASKMKLSTVWIDRKQGKSDIVRASGDIDESIRPSFNYPSMKAFAEAALNKNNES